MNSSSSSSHKSEARSPFPCTPLDQFTVGVDHRMKRKLDFGCDLFINNPLMEIGCSALTRPTKMISLHLKDESITQPLDEDVKGNQIYDLVGQDDKSEKGSCAVGPAGVTFFPRNLNPPLGMIYNMPTTKFPGEPSHTPTEIADKRNDTIKELQERIAQLEAELETLRQTAMENALLSPIKMKEKPATVPCNEPEDDVLAFQNWYSSEDPVQRNMRIPVPTMESQGVPRIWFRAILDKHEFISDEHIDSILNLLICEHKSRRGIWMNKWGLMDMVCWQALTQPNYELVEALVMPYVIGDSPATVGVPWDTFHSVYGVGHVMSNHWLLYEVKFLEQRIVIYDPHSHRLSFSDYKKDFENMTFHIPSLLRAARLIFDRDGVDIPPRRKWELVRFYNTPQQKSNQDAAIMSLEYLKCFINDQDLDSVDQNECDACRLTYCAAIYKFGLKLLREGGGAEA